MKISRLAWCVGILFLITGLAAVEAAAGPLTQVGQWLPLGTRAHDVVVRDNRAYVATDLGLTIVNISNLSGPTIVSSVNLGGKTFGLAVKDSYVYLANQTTDFKVVDVSTESAPMVVATRSLPSYTWDVAVKDNVAYVASFGGELYLFDITTPTNPIQFAVLGLPAWSNPGSDETNVEKLNNHVTSGNAKVTGVSVAGNILSSLDWNYGRTFHWNVADVKRTPLTLPVFLGTHYAPFTFRVEADPQRDVAYTLAAFGNSSGIYSLTLSEFNEDQATHFTTCDRCDYFKSPATDYGGLAVSSNGDYVMYIAGKRGVVQVLDVSNPADIKDAGSVAIPAHGSKTADSMGIAQYGAHHIITAAGSLGLGVFQFVGNLSD